MPDPLPSPAPEPEQFLAARIRNKDGQVKGSGMRFAPASQPANANTYLTIAEDSSVIDQMNKAVVGFSTAVKAISKKLETAADLREQIRTEHSAAEIPVLHRRLKSVERATVRNLGRALFHAQDMLTEVAQTLQTASDPRAARFDATFDDRNGMGRVSSFTIMRDADGKTFFEKGTPPSSSVLQRRFVPRIKNGEELSPVGDQLTIQQARMNFQTEDDLTAFDIALGSAKHLSRIRTNLKDGKYPRVIDAAHEALESLSFVNMTRQIRVDNYREAAPGNGFHPPENLGPREPKPIRPSARHAGAQAPLEFPSRETPAFAIAGR